MLSQNYGGRIFLKEEDGEKKWSTYKWSDLEPAGEEFFLAWAPPRYPSFSCGLELYTNSSIPGLYLRVTEHSDREDPLSTVPSAKKKNKKEQNFIIHADDNEYN